MKFGNRTVFCVVYRGQRADGTAAALIPMRGRCSYISLQALWPIRSVQPAAQLPISRCEDGMLRLNSCLRIRVVGGVFSWHFGGWTDW